MSKNEIEYAEDFEMNGILNDAELMKKLKKGSSDAKNNRGCFSVVKYTMPDYLNQ